MGQGRPAAFWSSVALAAGARRPYQATPASSVGKRAIACHTTLPPQQKPVMPTLSALAQAWAPIQSRVAEMSPITWS